MRRQKQCSHKYKLYTVLHDGIILIFMVIMSAWVILKSITIYYLKGGACAVEPGLPGNQTIELLADADQSSQGRAGVHSHDEAMAAVRM